MTSRRRAADESDRKWSGSNEELTSRIIGAAIEVHRSLGPGFVERIYRNALLCELGLAGLYVEMEKEVDVFFKGVRVGRQRLDLSVESCVVIELKAVDALAGVHYAQLRSHLRAIDLHTGLLINFAGTRIDCRRVSWDP